MQHSPIHKNANNLENPSVVFRVFLLNWPIWPPKLKRLPYSHKKQSEMKKSKLKCDSKQEPWPNYLPLKTCVKVANEAVQIHGGYGFTKDFPVEKFLRDSKLCTIGEGTSEIQKVVIARKIYTAIVKN